MDLGIRLCMLWEFFVLRHRFLLRPKASLCSLALPCLVPFVSALAKQLQLAGGSHSQ